MIHNWGHQNLTYYKSKVHLTEITFAYKSLLHTICIFLGQEMSPFPEDFYKNLREKNLMNF